MTGEEMFTSLTAARVVLETQGLRPLFLVDKLALEDFKGNSWVQEFVFLFFIFLFLFFIF